MLSTPQKKDLSSNRKKDLLINGCQLEAVLRLHLNYK